MRWSQGKEKNSEGSQGQKRAGVGTMIVGGIFLVLGVIATIVSYSMASGGGTYFVFYGAMIFGALDLVVGLVRYLSTPKQEATGGGLTAAVDPRHVHPTGDTPPALSDPGRLSAIDPFLSPSPACVDGSVVPATVAPAGPAAPGFTVQPTGPTADVLPQTEMPAASLAGVTQFEAAAEPVGWMPSAGGEGGQLYFDEAAVTRLREQTRVYYAQQSMRAQGKCEICGRGLTRAARWRGSVRCPDHL